MASPHLNPLAQQKYNSIDNASRLERTASTGGCEWGKDHCKSSIDTKCYIKIKVVDSKRNIKVGFSAGTVEQPRNWSPTTCPQSKPNKQKLSKASSIRFDHRPYPVQFRIFLKTESKVLNVLQSLIHVRRHHWHFDLTILKRSLFTSQFSILHSRC